MIKSRIKYFQENPKEMAEFYFRKTRSMWAEPSYGGLFYNQNFQYKEEDRNVKYSTGYHMVQHYQRALIFIIVGGTLLTLIKNRKNLSNEVILLITIFIGGFLFHTMWEAKSRYVFPYIMVLIPVAIIELDIKKTLKKFKRNDEN